MSPEPMNHERTRKLKATIGSKLDILPPIAYGSISTFTHDDEEMNMIRKFRQHDDASWADIVKRLNEARVERGEIADLDEEAAYCKFILGEPRPAKASGDTGFDAKEFLHLRNATSTLQKAKSMGVGAGIGRKRIRGEDTIAEDLAPNIRRISASRSGQMKELREEKMTELLVEAVAYAERNFWSYVRDELERKSAKMFDPEACESRFHEV